MPSDKVVKFTLIVYEVSTSQRQIHYEQSGNVLAINRSSIQTKDDMLEVIHKIEKFSPAWLYIQPFVLQRLLICYQEDGMSPSRSLRYIESVGELLPKDLQKSAAKFFKVPVANMYGSEEMNGIAYECPYGYMHVLEDNVYVECLTP